MMCAWLPDLTTLLLLRKLFPASIFHCVCFRISMSFSVLDNVFAEMNANFEATVFLTGLFRDSFVLPKVQTQTTSAMVNEKF